MIKQGILKQFLNEVNLEAGCDEAGRGCLAGPVFAAAVILPKKFYHPLLNDSKKVNVQNREILRSEIEKTAISYAVSFCTNEEIDKINILNASILAMHRALEKLGVIPNHILVDGNRFKKFRNISHTCIVKGDSIYASIAAASILAKTYRDDFMLKICNEFPMYSWDRNKGYPTGFHKKAITDYGICHYHRKSFNCGFGQLKLSI